MDEKTAWENFVSSGSVMDYLKYCESKEPLLQNEWKNISSEGFYDCHGRSDIKGTERRRK